MILLRLIILLYSLRHHPETMIIKCDVIDLYSIYNMLYDLLTRAYLTKCGHVNEINVPVGLEHYFNTWTIEDFQKALDAFDHIWEYSYIHNTRENTRPLTIITLTRNDINELKQYGLNQETSYEPLEGEGYFSFYNSKTKLKISIDVRNVSNISKIC